MRHRLMFSVIAGISAFVCLSLGEEALAAPPDCSSLPNPVYIQSGDTQEPLLKALGKQLRDSKVNPISLIYKTSGSCTNIDAIFNDTKLTTNPFYIPSSAEDPTWNPSKPAPQCVIDPKGVSLDIANSNVFISACTQSPPPAGIGSFQGPVQPYLFVVPEASKQRAITAEEAYFAFGFGAAGKVEPWNDENFFFIRTTTKSTLLSMAAATGVPAAKWKGKPFDKSSEVVAAVSGSANPEKTIGILGAEIYDQHRDTLNALAYQAYGQKYAYFPDSTATSRDKRTLRDGHYTIWSPTVYLAKVDDKGKIKDARVKYIVDMILSHAVSPSPDFDPLSTVISKGLVPDCAMKVTRSFEGGDLSLYTPSEPCGCFFESKVGTPGVSCKTCVDDKPCGSGKCRYGFCEAR